MCRLVSGMPLDIMTVCRHSAGTLQALCRQSAGFEVIYAAIYPANKTNYIPCLKLNLTNLLPLQRYIYFAYPPDRRKNLDNDQQLPKQNLNHFKSDV